MQTLQLQRRHRVQVGRVEREALAQVVPVFAHGDLRTEPGQQVLGGISGLLDEAMAVLGITAQRVTIFEAVRLSAAKGWGH